jgi:hypothetical protein
MRALMPPAARPANTHFQSLGAGLAVVGDRSLASVRDLCRYLWRKRRVSCPLRLRRLSPSARICLPAVAGEIRGPRKAFIRRLRRLAQIQTRHSPTTIRSTSPPRQYRTDPVRIRSVPLCVPCGEDGFTAEGAEEHRGNQLLQAARFRVFRLFRGYTSEISNRPLSVLCN